MYFEPVLTEHAIVTINKRNWISNSTIYIFPLIGCKVHSVLWLPPLNCNRFVWALPRSVRILSGRKLLSIYFDHFSDQNMFKKLPSVYQWQNTNHILNLNGASKREYAIWFCEGRLRWTWTTCATETTNTPRHKLRTERYRFVTEVLWEKI